MYSKLLVSFHNLVYLVVQIFLDVENFQWMFSTVKYEALLMCLCLNFLYLEQRNAQDKNSEMITIIIKGLKLFSAEGNCMPYF